MMDSRYLFKMIVDTVLKCYDGAINAHCSDCPLYCGTNLDDIGRVDICGLIKEWTRENEGI